MIDFILDVLSEIGEFFLDLWLNKIGGRSKKKKEEDSEKAD